MYRLIFQDDQLDMIRDRDEMYRRLKPFAPGEGEGYKVYERYEAKNGSAYTYFTKVKWIVSSLFASKKCLKHFAAFIE
ncbi:hypothetical protein ACEQPO_08715 [Bacillus sp. SL00103]